MQVPECIQRSLMSRGDLGGVGIGFFSDRVMIPVERGNMSRILDVQVVLRSHDDCAMPVGNTGHRNTHQNGHRSALRRPEDSTDASAAS